MTVLYSPSPFTYPPCHLVERQALGTVDGEALVVMLPGGKQQELTAHAGFHPAPAGLGKVGKAVLLKDNQRETFIEGGTHDLLLALGDAGRHKDGSLTGEGEELPHLGGYLRRGEAAKAFTTAIEKCGELLAEKFPAHEENPNEFPDGLVIVEDAEW